MGERIDDLEKHVADLMAEAGIENTDEESKVKKLYFSCIICISTQFWNMGST